MKFGRHYHLAYRHRKARVRKKNQHRFKRECRIKAKRTKCFFKTLPDDLKALLKDAKPETYSPDYQYPLTRDWWWDDLNRGFYYCHNPIPGCMPAFVLR